jgi:hypothetical protein
MRRILILAAVLFFAAHRPLTAQATRQDTAAVLATVQRLFDALAQRDTAVVRALLVPGARFVSMRADTASAPRAQGDAELMRMLTRGTERLLERFWSPVIQIQGPIATVWTPYDFHVEGQWSHCGIDTFTLMRTGAEWRIAALAYTVQLRGCAPSPLGPPR